MKRNNGWPRVKILESGEATLIPLKGKRVISKNGKEYLRYSNHDSSKYKNFSEEKKLEIFEPNFRRNYIHVKDIVDSLLRITENEPTNEIDCLGSPDGHSVREVIDAMANVSRANLEVIEGPRRLGDVDISTVPTKSKYFKQNKSLEDMCIDAIKYEV